MKRSGLSGLRGPLWNFRMRTLLLAVSSMAHAESLPVRGVLDPRVRTAEYDPGQVYRLPAFVGYQIDLQFEPGEHFVGVGAGDIEALSFTSQGNHLFLKPRVATVATNLTVLTDRRPYQFEYSALARRPDPHADEVIYALRFAYELISTPVAAAASEPARIADALKIAASNRPHYADYRYCGAKALRPIDAFDDGVQLHLRFAAGRDLPAFFAHATDGTESLVGFTVEADEVIVHRLVERLVLRRGRLVGCLVNPEFGRAGIALEGGTLSPQVIRQTRESTP